MTQPLITTYRWIEAHEETNTPVLRGYWDIHRERNPGFAKRQHDPVYRNLIKRIYGNYHYDSLCEIGSDLGRSTAWLSSVATNIDVYDRGRDYLHFCKSQCNGHQRRFGPITNVTWHDVKDNTIGETIQKLPKQYDCIKLITYELERYIPMLKTKIKPTGHLLIWEQDRNYRDRFLAQLNTHGLEVDNTINSVYIVKHK